LQWRFDLRGFKPRQIGEVGELGKKGELLVEFKTGLDTGLIPQFTFTLVRFTDRADQGTLETGSILPQLPLPPQLPQLSL